MQTLLFEIANLVNERPIGKIPTTPQDGTYLCPNDMLLDRSFNKCPSGNFNVNSSRKKRINFVQTMTDMFWKKLMQFYFASLVIRKTWHHEQRDAAVDDIVIILRS